MEKDLENARFAQTFLVGAAAAALIFSLSSPSVENYGLMERLLGDIQLLNFEQPKKSIDGSLSERLQKARFHLLLQSYNASNPPVPLSAESFDWKQYNSLDSLKNIVQARPLSEIDNAIARKYPVSLFLPDFPQLFATLTASRAVFETRTTELKKGFKIGFIEYSNRPEYGYQLQLTWTHPDPSQAAAGIQRFEQLGDNNFPGTQVVLEDVDLASWVRSQLGVDTLWSILKPPVWSAIKDSDVSRALLIVKNLNAQALKSFNFTNLTIPSAIMVLAGPVILTSIMLYLLVHLNHVHLLLRDTKHDEISFPWICLYPDRLSRVVSLVATCVLPIVACVLLVANIEGVAPVARAVGGLLCVVCAIVGIVLGRQVSRLPEAIAARA